MSTEPRPTAKEVFLLARELPQEARLAAVDQACGTDRTLRDEVLELLAFNDRLGPERDAEPGSSDPLVGRRLGEYRIEARIGSGGMGVVYVAEQQHPHRRVALKLLRTVVSTPVVLRRFHNEADLLARLAHPDIARVFAAGTLEIDGVAVPYLAMELVESAAPVTVYAQQQRLSLEERIALFAKVCDAVHHGHQKAVIHRDLKPDNILVDGDGNPKLIDFGVARLLDTSMVLGTIQTAPGQLIGTLQYMCPEQCTGAAADLDVRGDVYSLGVVLYELVTGEAPLDLSSDTWVSAMNRIRTEVPATPSRIRFGVPRALDAILAKTLAKKRDHRYGSAAALAGDLRAFLAGNPIQAQPPTAWQRAASWIARHPALSTASLCALIATTAGTALWLLARYYAMLPSHVTFYETTGEVCLESRSGVRLYTWQSPLQIEDARLVDLGENRQRVLLIHYYHARDGGVDAGHVCLYPINPPSSLPLWTTARELGPFQREMERNPQLMLSTTFAKAADLIDAAPGNELLVVHRLVPGDLTGIRVFDSGGRLRYATYHRGSVNNAAPIPGTDRIAVAALNSRHTWGELGVACDEWPSVAFVLDVVDGHRGPEVGIIDGRDIQDPTVAWYRWFGPPAKIGPAVRFRLYVASEGFERHFKLQLNVMEAPRRNGTPLLSLLLDESGKIVHVYPYDSYDNARLKGFPPLAECELLPIEDLPEPP